MVGELPTLQSILEMIVVSLPSSFIERPMLFLYSPRGLTFPELKLPVGTPSLTRNDQTATSLPRVGRESRLRLRLNWRFYTAIGERVADGRIYPVPATVHEPQDITLKALFRKLAERAPHLTSSAWH
jgi:hypothetical protein